MQKLLMADFINSFGTPRALTTRQYWKAFVFLDLRTFRMFFCGRWPVLRSTKLSRLSGGGRIRGKSLRRGSKRFLGVRFTKGIIKKTPPLSPCVPRIFVRNPLEFVAGPN